MQRAMPHRIKQRRLSRVLGVLGGFVLSSHITVHLRATRYKHVPSCSSARQLTDRVSAGLSKSPICIQDKQQQTIKTTRRGGVGVGMLFKVPGRWIRYNPGNPVRGKD